MVSSPFTYRVGVKSGAVVVSLALAGTMALTGCSGSDSAEPAPSPHPVVTPTCPSVAPSAAPTTGKDAKALRRVPFDLPMPANITVVDSQVTPDGISVVKFTTPTSLRDAVIFIVGKYPKAGYVLGRGDAEATEADAPFIHGQLRGLTRVASLQTCQTLWLVASTTAKTNTGGTSPVLSPHPTSSQTSALPFG